MFLSPPAFEHLLDWVRHWGANERSIITFYGTWEARVLGKQELLWWGDNAPYHVYNYPYFDRLFPNSKFILLIRDPRDVYASGKVSFEWGLESVYWRWELALLNGLLAETQFGSTRVKRVMYERLVTVPQEQLQEICSFLGIDYTEEMLRFYESDAAKSIAQLGHHTNLLKPAFTSAIGKFRQVLTKEEIAAIEDRLNTPMESLGYLTHEEWERITLEKLSKSSHAAG